MAVVMDGMVMVKTIARGRQRRRAQKRESGLGDSMLLMLSTGERSVIWVGVAGFQCVVN